MSLSIIKALGKRLAYPVLGAGVRGRLAGDTLVLMFHRVLPRDHPEWPTVERPFTLHADVFEALCAFVAREFEVLDLEALTGGVPPGGAGPRVLFTFDDGWRDTLTVAGPIVRRHGIRPTLFLAGSVLDDPRDVWWQDAVIRLANTARLDDRIGHPAVRAALHEAAGRASGHERVCLLLKALAAMPDAVFASAVDAIVGEAYPLPPASGRQMLRRADLPALREDFDLGVHGFSHVPLDLVDDPVAELGRAIEALGAPCRAVSLPHGRGGARVLDACAKLGLRHVFTSEAVINGGGPSGDGIRGRVNVAHELLGATVGRFDAAHAFFALLRRPVRPVHALTGAACATS